MLTNGSQQGLDLVCKTFLDEQDCIIVEDPSYLAALGLFHMYNATIKAVPLHANGVDIQNLKGCLNISTKVFLHHPCLSKSNRILL
ncbi:MAG: hypothetical protein LRY68_09870 [Sulfurospirillum sp.]|nr:hypothetical protein [Sulfurospirillum sp.]